MIWTYLKRSMAVITLLFLLGAGVGLVVLQAKKGHLLSVQSGSMVPSFRKGDLVIATRVPENKLAIGDVVTYINPRNNKQTITHRLVEIEAVQNKATKFYTKGDANPGVDEPIYAKSIVGKTLFHVPYAGFLFDFIRKPLGLLLVVYVPALVLIIHEMRLLSAYYKSREPYRDPLLMSRLRGKEKSGGPTPAVGLKLVAFFVLLSFFFIVPVNAALQSSAELTGNTISMSPVVPPVQGNDDDIFLIRLKFTCSEDNTAALNRIPGLRIYNKSDVAVDVSGWHFDAGNGRIVTIPNGTNVAPRTSQNFDQAFPAGIDYAGDFIRLSNNENEEIDAISWGSNTSELNPSLAVVDGDWRYQRSAPAQDTDSASDWELRDGGGCRPGQF